MLIIPIRSTCFGGRFRPSSRALDCVYSLWYNAPTMLPAGSLEAEELRFQVKLYSVCALICTSPVNTNSTVHEASGVYQYKTHHDVLLTVVYKHLIQTNLISFLQLLQWRCI